MFDFAIASVGSGDHVGKEQGAEWKPCRAALQCASDVWRPSTFPGSRAPSLATATLDVEDFLLDELRALLDELEACLRLVAHQPLD